MAAARSSSTPPAGAGEGVRNAIKLGATALVTPAGPMRPPVEIRTSSRRRKTATAFFEGDKIVVVVPVRMRTADRAEMAERLVVRLLNRRSRTSPSDADLARRAGQLSDRYLGGVRPRSIRWVTNQNKRWGSCTPATGVIRISHHLQVVPDWVLDSVLVHELAHLLDASHSARFHALTARFPRLAEAEAYLAGYSLGMSSRGWLTSCDEDRDGDGAGTAETEGTAVGIHGGMVAAAPATAS